MARIGGEFGTPSSIFEEEPRSTIGPELVNVVARKFKADVRVSIHRLKRGHPEEPSSDILDPASSPRQAAIDSISGITRVIMPLGPYSTQIKSTVSPETPSVLTTNQSSVAGSESSPSV